MVGLGEERNEVLQVMDDLRSADVDFLTIGQYLQPTRKHHAVMRFVTPDEFAGLRDGRLRQGLPDGVGEPADALVASCRRGFRQAARRRAQRLRAERRCRKFTTKRRVAHTRGRRCSISSPTSSAIRNSCRCAALKVRQRKPSRRTETIVADMTVAYKLIRETFTSRVTLDRPKLQDPGRISRRAVQPHGKPLDLRAEARHACEVEFFIDYEFKSRMLAMCCASAR